LINVATKKDFWKRWPKLPMQTMPFHRQFGMFGISVLRRFHQTILFLKFDIKLPGVNVVILKIVSPKNG
jgi:hypothetical protein